MSRYIDADEIKRQWEIYGSLDVMDRILADAFPTVDVVPVVRCGECIHLTHDNIAPGWRRRCELWGDGKEESWFCADGEKVTES